MSELRLDQMDRSEACDASSLAFDNATALKRRWDTLVLALGWTTTISAIVLIAAATAVVFIPKSVDLGGSVTAAVGAVGTVVAGAGFVFIVKMSKSAARASSQALRDVAKYCSEQKIRTILATRPMAGL